MSTKCELCKRSASVIFGEHIICVKCFQGMKFLLITEIKNTSQGFFKWIITSNEKNRISLENKVFIMKKNNKK